MPQNRKIKIPSVGDLVRSTQGRDRYRVFLVTETDSGNKTAPIVIADGRLHTLSDKKHKNPRHLQIIKPSVILHSESIENELSDVQVYEICEKCEF